MGAWDTAIFSDDVAADVREDWRDLILDGVDAAAASQKLIDDYAPARQDPDDAPVFWLALAAAQMETGRLQDDARDRALAVIDAGGDVQRWQQEDPALGRQREKVLTRLADKLRGP